MNGLFEATLGLLPILVICVKYHLKGPRKHHDYTSIPGLTFDEILSNVERHKSLLHFSLRSRIFLFITSILMSLIPLCSSITILILSVQAKGAS